MGWKPQLSIFLNDKKWLKQMHTAYTVVMNVLNRQIKIKHSKCCFMTTLYYDVPKRKYLINAESWQRFTVTKRNNQTMLRLLHDNGILWRSRKNTLEWRCFLTTVYFAILWQSYTIYDVLERAKFDWRCLLTTVYYDVLERTNYIDAVSWHWFIIT